MNYGRETLELDRGKAEIIKFQMNEQNSLTRQNMEELQDILKEIQENDQIKGVILTSDNPKFFCNGLDGDTLLSTSGEELLGHVGGICILFGHLLRFDKPLITEVTGHAMGGGAVITSASDYRYMLSTGCRIAFTEVLVGLPLPAMFVSRIQETVNPIKVTEICLEAANYKGKEAKEVGMIDDVAETKEELRKFSIKKLDTLFRLPIIAVRQTKQNVNKRSLFRYEEYLEETKKSFQAPGVIENLREGMLAVKERRRPNFK